MPDVKLTKPQLAELKQLANKPQNTYGSSRTRVQNTLVKKGLAQYLDDCGGPVRTINGFVSETWLVDRCAITDKGRACLKELADV